MNGRTRFQNTLFPPRPQAAPRGVVGGTPSVGTAWEHARQAVQDGQPERLARLLPSIDAGAPDSHGETLLMLACRSTGRSACLDLLLPLSDVHHVAPGGITALLLAASFGDRPMVERLWTTGEAADRAHHDDEGHDALWRAADHGHTGVLGFLLAQPELSPLRQDPRGRSAWTQAAGRDTPDGLVVLTQACSHGPAPSQEHLERALDAAFMNNRWRNACVLVSAMDPASALAHLARCSGRWIEALTDVARAAEKAALSACIEPSSRSRPRPRL